MKRKQIRLHLEKILKNHDIFYNIKENKRKKITEIEILFSSLPLEFHPAKIFIYQKYIECNLLCWTIYEKVMQEEKEVLLLSLLQDFLNKNLKIQVFYHKNKPVFCKVYCFKENYWELYQKCKEPLFFNHKNYEALELDIDDLTQKKAKEDVDE